MSNFIFIVGRRITNLNINLTMGALLFSIIALYILFLYLTMGITLEKNYLPMIGGGLIVGIALIFIYFKFQKITFGSLLKVIRNRKQ
jgi:hypothetical protein